MSFLPLPRNILLGYGFRIGLAAVYAEQAQLEVYSHVHFGCFLSRRPGDLVIGVTNAYERSLSLDPFIKVGNIFS